MTGHEFAERLGARPAGKGWEARCPAHDDQVASLSIGLGEDGRVLVKCHAGCTLDTIVAAAGLTVQDLFPAKPATATKHRAKKRIVATYDYRDADGTLLYQTVRYEPKHFHQRRPDGNGGWKWELEKDVKRVPYRLSDVIGRRIVFVSEGEKDADILNDLGYPATTNVGGAGKWRNSYSDLLYAGGTRIVGVFEDNDEAGRQHAAHVVESCRDAGLVAAVIALPDLPEKGDVSDYLTTHTPADLETLITAAITAIETSSSEPSTPASMDLAAILTDVETFIHTYVVLSTDAAILVTLWIAQTFGITAFDYVAYLHIKSPTSECGKTRVLEVLEALVKHPWLTGRVTAAVLMRKIDDVHPVLLLDESDAAFNGDQDYAEALRGQLNTGFQRSGKASACVGQGANLGYKDFSTFGPKAIAGIGSLNSTLESRSIPIALKRRTKAEPIKKWRRRDAWKAAEPLRRRLLSAMTAAVETLKSSRPAIPDGLSDRADDVLEPLFAIADIAGGDWPTRCRDAAVALMGTAARVAQETDQNLGLELLADIRTIFADHDNPEALKTKVIIDGLTAIEDRPWATFTKEDKPITPHRLSLILKGFDVQPGGQMRVEGEKIRGYRLASLEDAFNRYLPRDPDFKAVQRDNPNENGGETHKNEAVQASAVPLQKTAIPPIDTGVCTAVPLQTPDHEDNGTDDDEDDEAEYYGA